MNNKNLKNELIKIRCTKELKDYLKDNIDNISLYITNLILLDIQNRGDKDDLSK